ncbi:MAG TPA: hypothetical protein VHC69_31605 [Polyangiaceae bacterium]|nr:hypothetical protein [Polyangiaceae bacterium]
MQQKREADEKAARAAEEHARQQVARAEQDPRLPQKAAAAESEIQKLEAAFSKATAAVEEIAQQVAKATASGNEEELARLDGILNARKRIQAHAETALQNACDEHQFVRQAAKRIRDCERLEQLRPRVLTNGRGEAVEQEVSTLMGIITDFQNTILEQLECIHSHLQDRNSEAITFDNLAIYLGLVERAGKATVPMILTDVTQQLTPHIHSGFGTRIFIQDEGNSAKLIFEMRVAAPRELVR